MTINRKQRFVLLAGAALTLGAIVFPPLHIVVGEGGRAFSHSIGFLFDSYAVGTHLSINVSLLFVELIGVSVATGFALLAFSADK